MDYAQLRQLAYNCILINNIATEAELELVTNMDGYNINTLKKVIAVRTGLNTFEQLAEEGYTVDEALFELD